MTYPIMTHHGVDIPRDPAIVSGRIAKSIEAGRYERQEVQGTPKFITAEDRVIELGAGIGFISSFLYRQLNVRNILCVEANPILCDFIRRVHKLNGVDGVDIRTCVALNGTQQSGAMTFYVRDPFWSSSLDPAEGYESTVEVDGVALSDLIREFRANVLIVDIEGGEKTLFHQTDLTGIDKIFLEIHTRKIRQIGIKKCFDDLSAAGFCYDQQVSRGGAVLFRRIPDRQLRQG